MFTPTACHPMMVTTYAFCVGVATCRFSIHVQDRTSEEVKAAQQSLPALVPGTKNVYANGW